MNQYIETCGHIHQHAQIYLSSEERIAADIFLGNIVRDLRIKTKFGRYVRKCAVQLSNFTSLYFRNYDVTLEMKFMEFMAQSPSINQIVWSGLVKQAAATLPEALVLNVVRRELRRLGLEYDRLLVPQDIVDRRIKRIS